MSGFGPAHNNTNTSPAASGTTGVLLAANRGRKGATIWNEGSTVLYIAFAATATLTAYVAQVAPGGYYELPPSRYTGAVSGIWAGSPTGNARVNEQT